MATLQEVIQHIKSNYVADVTDSGQLKLEFNVGGDRTQLIFVHSAESMILIASPFANNISSDLAFQAASDSLFGVKKMGDVFLLHHVIPINDIDASEIEFGLKMLAIQADDVERKFGGDSF